MLPGVTAQTRGGQAPGGLGQVRALDGGDTHVPEVLLQSLLQTLSFILLFRDLKPWTNTNHHDLLLEPLKNIALP